MPQPISYRRLLLLLCVVAAGLCVHARAATVSSPAILRTDAFIATPYDDHTAIVFFGSNALIPVGLGAPAGKLPKSVAMMAGWSAKLRLENSNEETRWRKYWPGGEAYAPKLGQQYVLAVGGHLEHGVVASVGYLQLCSETWLVGLVTVGEADQTKFADSQMPVGLVAYPEPEGGLPVLRSIDNPDAFARLPSSDVMKDDHSIGWFALDELPMLNQGDDNAGEAEQKILLTGQRTGDGATYSLKRVTPGGLVPAGVYFETSCKGFFSEVYASQEAQQSTQRPAH